jgi:putative aminopeptidase FrvX
MAHPARDEDGFLLEDPRDDGAVLLRYGSVGVALGWPLRYSHSPAELIDTRDLDPLAKSIALISKPW